MKLIGKYCKAYPVSRFRDFPEWHEDLDYVSQADGQPKGEEMARTSLTDSDHLYLQEDYTVTHGIYRDENVVYKRITPAWISFCINQLHFRVPDRRE